MALLSRLRGFFGPPERGLGVIAPSMPDAHPRVVLAGSGRTGLVVEPNERDVLLEEHCDEVYDQVGTQSCLAQSMASAAVTTAAARYGETLKRPSRRWLYYLLRRKAQNPVRDIGGYTSHALEVPHEYGFIPEEFFPWSTWKIDEKPSMDLAVAAYPHRRIANTYAIDGPDELDATLHSRRAGVICVQVDETFQRDDGPTVIEGPPAGRIKGGHAMEVIGVQWVAGRRQYRVKNSWGTAWRDRGYAWVDEWWAEHAYDSACIDFKEAA